MPYEMVGNVINNELIAGTTDGEEIFKKLPGLETVYRSVYNYFFSHVCSTKLLVHVFPESFLSSSVIDLGSTRTRYQPSLLIVA